KLQTSLQGPGVKLLEGEQGISATSPRCLLDGVVFEREGFPEELAGRFWFERCDVDGDAGHQLAQLSQSFGSWGSQVDFFCSDRSDDHVRLVVVFDVHATKTFERRFRSVV